MALSLSSSNSYPVAPDRNYTISQKVPNNTNQMRSIILPLHSKQQIILPTLLRKSVCPPLHYYHNKYHSKEHKKTHEDDDCTSSDNENNYVIHDSENHSFNNQKQFVATLENDVQVITQHVTQEHQIYQKLSIAAIRSAKSIQVTSLEERLALFYRWQEIRLLLYIETLRRDAHIHRNQHNTTSTSSAGAMNHKNARSILALEHFPRAASTSNSINTRKSTTVSGNNGQKLNINNSKRNITNSHKIGINHLKATAATAWEGTVYKHKLLTSLYYKLSLKLIFFALQSYAKQQRHIRRMLSTVPSLRPQKLLQVSFLHIVQYAIHSKCIEEQSLLQAQKFRLYKQVKPFIRQWYVHTHATLPRLRRHYVAAIAYAAHRQKQFVYAKLMHDLLWQRKMRRWQQKYRYRSDLMRAWLSWQYMFRQRQLWRQRVYETFNADNTSTAATHKSAYSVNKSSILNNSTSSSKINFNDGNNNGNNSNIDNNTSNLSVREYQLHLRQEQQWLAQEFRASISVCLPFIQNNTTNTTKKTNSTTNKNVVFLKRLAKEKDARQALFHRSKHSRFDKFNTTIAITMTPHDTKTRGSRRSKSYHDNSHTIVGYESESDQSADSLSPQLQTQIDDDDDEDSMNEKGFPPSLSPLTHASSPNNYHHRRRGFQNHNDKSSNNFTHSTTHNTSSSSGRFSPTSTSSMRKSGTSVYNGSNPNQSFSNYSDHDTSFASYALSTSASTSRNRHSNMNHSSSSMFSNDSLLLSVRSGATAASSSSQLIEDVLSQTSRDMMSSLLNTTKNMDAKINNSTNIISSANTVVTATEGTHRKNRHDNQSYQHGGYEKNELALVVEDDCDPLQALPTLLRDNVYRFMQEKRSIWYFQHCCRFFRTVRYDLHCRKHHHQLAQLHKTRATVYHWKTWFSLYQKKMQQYILCDRIHAHSHQLKVFTVWQESFFQRYHLYQTNSDWIAHMKKKRLVRRRFQKWRTLFQDRKLQSTMNKTIEYGIIRRVLKGWKSVIGMMQYSQRASKIVIKRRLQPLFQLWHKKCTQKQLLRRVFTVQEHAWAIRSLPEHDVHENQSNVHGYTNCKFARLHTVFHAWSEYVRAQSQERWQRKYYQLALCFRGASLLARHFVAWRALHRQQHRLLRWYQQRKQQKVRTVFQAWKTYMVEVLRPETMKITRFAQDKRKRQLWRIWVQSSQKRHTQVALVTQRQLRYRRRHYFQRWCLAIRAKRLKKQLQLLTPPPAANNKQRRLSQSEDAEDEDVDSISTSTSTSMHSINSSDKENKKLQLNVRRLQEKTQQVQFALSPYHAQKIHLVEKDSKTLKNSRRGNVKHIRFVSSEDRTENEADPPFKSSGGTNDKKKRGKNLKNSVTLSAIVDNQDYHPKYDKHNPIAAFSDDEREEEDDDDSQSKKEVGITTTGDTTTEPKVWTNKSQAMKARRFLNIWRNFFYRQRRYKRGFRLLEKFFYTKKLQHYFLYWPGRGQIMKAEKMRNLSVARGGSSRLQLVDYDPDEVIRLRQTEHTQRRQAQAEQSLEEVMKTMPMMSSYQQYRFLAKQRQDAEERKRQMNPSSRNVFVSRSFVQRAPPTLNELAYAYGYLQKIPDPEGLLRLKDLLGTLLYHWRRHILAEKMLRLRSVEIRSRLRHKLLLMSVRKWIATTPRVSYRIITWLNNVAERKAFLDSQRWAEHQSESQRDLLQTMDDLTCTGNKRSSSSSAENKQRDE